MQCSCSEIGLGQVQADCSSLSLDYIPKFWENVTHINMSNNPLGTILNVLLPSNLRSLDLSRCGIREFQRGILSNYSKLEYLDISYNRELSLNSLPNITYDLQYTSIKVLRVNALQCALGPGTSLLHEHLVYLRNTSLEEIYMSSNRIETIEQFVLLNLPRTLKSFTAMDNRLKPDWYLLDLGFLENLRMINVNDQFKGWNILLSVLSSIKYVDPSCDDNRQSTKYADHFPMRIRNYDQFKRDINVQEWTPCWEGNNDIITNRSIAIYICFLRNIEILCFEKYLENSMWNPQWEIPIYVDCHSAKRFDGSKNSAAPLSGIFSKSLVHADLSNNDLMKIDPFMLQSDTQITYLDLSGNFLSEQVRNARPFEGQQLHLQYLSLANNKIYEIPEYYFDRFINIKHLDLSGNILGGVAFNLDRLQHLEVLDLHNNEIHALTVHQMKILDEIANNKLRTARSKLVIDLSGNDLLCSCETIDFIRWIKQHSHANRIVFRNYYEYSCTYTNMSKVSLSNFTYLLPLMEKTCASYKVLILVCIGLIVASLTVIGAGIMYRLRWKIRYFYLMTKLGYRGTVRMRQLSDTDYRDMFRYDAFVSFANEDREFAFLQMIKEVEDKTDLELCFHERDFTPGRGIAENIADAVRASRKIFCVVSNNFFNSHWCLYEFHMALMERIHAREGNDMLFLVLLNDLCLKTAPSSMSEFIRSNCYLEYRNNETCTQMFWCRLIETIQ